MHYDHVTLAAWTFIVSALGVQNFSDLVQEEHQDDQLTRLDWGSWAKLKLEQTWGRKNWRFSNDKSLYL